MRQFSMQRIFLGVNLSIGVISSLVIALGGQLFSSTPIDWWNIISSGCVFTLFFISTHRVLCSSWVLQPLHQLMQMIRSSDSAHVSLKSFPGRIRELSDLAQLLVSTRDYSHDLAQKGYQLLERAGHQEIPLHTDPDVLGTVFQKLMNTANVLEDLIGEISTGNLAADMPEDFLETRLGQAFYGMTTELDHAIQNVRQEVLNISRVSARIAAMSQQGARNATMETRAIEHISSSIHEVVANLREVMHNIRRQGESLDKTFTDIEHMLASIENIHASVELLSSSAEETSRSISGIHEFMQEIDTHAHSLSDISETVATEATDGLQAVGAVIGGIQTIKNTVEDAAMAIQRLGEESGRIGEILDVINTVAEQTNLLALNASIIAAQAGEHGRGFAVVAGEVRELAERTRAATQEIGGIIRSLQAEVTHGATAMRNCLHAVSEGVELANHSGAILKKIVGNIQRSRDMASKLAQETVVQTTNSQHVTYATEQVIQKLEDLYAVASSQAKDSSHLGEMANILREVTQHIEQSAVVQLGVMDSIVLSIVSIQELLQRNAKMLHHLAESSSDLGALESNLADNMGHFLMTKHELPSDFDPNRPTIVFVSHGKAFLFQHIYQGVRSEVPTEKYQPVHIGAENHPVAQAEKISWLLQQHWLSGIVLAPVNEHTGSRLVANLTKQGTPIVVVDFNVKNADVSVVSNNTQGGEYAAEMLRAELPGEAVVLAFGSRNLYSVACRMNGFCKKAKSYEWTTTEIYAPSSELEGAKKHIQEGLNLFPNVQGVFLANETIVRAYLGLLREGNIPHRNLHVVGFDIAPEIAQAIAEGGLLGTIAQDAVQMGRVATQELLTLLQRPHAETIRAPRKVLIPVKKITQKNLSSTI